MTNQQPQQEPSMEEILASIRRIISDDDVPAASAVDDGPVLDLTPDMQIDAGHGGFTPLPSSPPPSPGPSIDELMASFDTPGAMSMPAPIEETAGVMFHAPDAATDGGALTYTPEVPVAFSIPVNPAPAPDHAPVMETPAMMASPDADRLMSQQTESAAAAALAGLSALAASSIQGSHKFEGHTVEALVRELLRPMLQHWIDANLPPLVERLMEEEIRRLSQRATGGR